MKKLLFPAVAALAGLVVLTAASPGKEESPERSVLRFERRWANAVVKKDVAAVEKIEADDFISIDPTGAMADKKEDLKNLRGTDLTFRSITLRKLKVRIYGETAVVTGTSEVDGKYQDDDISGAYSFTDVLVRTNGEWKAVSSQATRAAGE